MYNHTAITAELEDTQSIIDASNSSDINDLLLKTALSRNVTIEMWNTIIKYIVQFLKIFRNLHSVCKIINDFLNTIDTDLLDYNNLTNKPTLEGVELQGDVSIPCIEITTILNLN